jgi:Fe-S-cluster-containing dehydrogenase component
MTEKDKKKESGEISRRDFVAGTGAVLIGGAAGAIAGSAVFRTETEKVVEVEVPQIVEVEKVIEKAVEVKVPEIVEVEKQVVVEQEVVKEVTVEKEVPISYPLSEGYLVYDPDKCIHCLTCMMTCSAVNEGEVNNSLSRIQVVFNPYKPFPTDMEAFAVCRQCVDPLCVRSCPTGACHVDTANGNVRVIDESLCIGCKLCIQACPFMPHRTIWNPATNKATKCDLCLSAPYWGETGGPDGKQACVECCPFNAISLVKEAPIQEESLGYDVDLKSENYKLLVTKTASTWEVPEPTETL